MSSKPITSATSGLFLLCLLASGCGQTPAGVHPVKAKLTVERLVEADDLVVVRIHIEFPGERTVAVYEDGSSQTASIEPDDKFGPSKCDVLITADMVDVGQKRHIKWLHRIQSSRVTAGGPSTYEVDRNAKLADLLKIQIQPGEYQFGSEIDLATFRGQPLRMRIE